METTTIDIDLDRADSQFVRDLDRGPGGERISACFTCRTCTASCPISAVNRIFNPMRIIRMALYGLKDAVLTSPFIWLCAGCYACQERCPQGVGITDFMTRLKNLAVREGHMPAGVKSQMELVKFGGRIYPIDDFDNKKRAKMDLPALPTSCNAVETLFPRPAEADGSPDGPQGTP